MRQNLHDWTWTWIKTHFETLRHLYRVWLVAAWVLSLFLEGWDKQTANKVIIDHLCTAAQMHQKCIKHFAHKHTKVYDWVPKTDSLIDESDCLSHPVSIVFSELEQANKEFTLDSFSRWRLVVNFLRCFCIHDVFFAKCFLVILLCFSLLQSILDVRFVWYVRPPYFSLLFYTSANAV